MKKTAVTIMLIIALPLMGCSMIHKKDNSNASKITNIQTSEAKTDKGIKNTTPTRTVTPKATVAPTPKPQIDIKYSADDFDYSAGGSVDLTLNESSDKKTLTVTSEDLLNVDDGNKPIKITLDINGSQVEFKSDWNDGIQVSVADFDKSDNLIDVYITECGTDISCSTYIYKYDGYDIFYYDQFIHDFEGFLYDENGYIYYSLNNGEKMEINKYYDYNGKCKDINDANLKDRLTGVIKKEASWN